MKIERKLYKIVPIDGKSIIYTVEIIQSQWLHMYDIGSHWHHLRRETFRLSHLTLIRERSQKWYIFLLSTAYFLSYFQVSWIRVKRLSNNLALWYLNAIYQFTKHETLSHHWRLVISTQSYHRTELQNYYSISTILWSLVKAFL